MDSVPSGRGATMTTAAPGSAPAVDFDQVSKWFKGVVAVSEVSFSLGPGITSLLGPNGAGKSTVLRMMCGLTPPSIGSVRVFGHDPRRHPAVLAQVGLVPQQDGVFPRLSALEFVRLAAVLHGISDADGAARRALATVEMDASESRSVNQYSKGMKQRVKLAQALVNSPALIIADEPLNGLDPRQRVRLIEVFQQLGAEGRTVVVSSHVLDEVERLGDRVLVVAEGRLAAAGSFQGIRELMDDRPHLIRIHCDRPHELSGRLLTSGLVRGASILDREHFECEVTEVARFRSEIVGAAREVGTLLRGVRPMDDDLESVFRYLVAGRSGTGTR